MSSFIKKIIFPILLCVAIFILTFTSINNFSAKQSDSTYIIKSYKNTVALYKNEELITVYDSIVLNTLPEKDIQSFNIGIEAATPEQAQTILEDYDS